MERVLVTIKDNKFIPTIGKGPINVPINVLKSTYDLLKNLGFTIQKVSEVNKLEPIEKLVVKKEKEVEKVTTEEIAEPIEETITAEIIESDEKAIEPLEEITEVKEQIQEEEKVIFTKTDLTSKVKKELKAICRDRGIEYTNENTNSELVELILKEQ